MLQIGEAARLAEALAGVRRTTADGLAQWRYHGRLVASQLDDTHLVIRSDQAGARLLAGGSGASTVSSGAIVPHPCWVMQVIGIWADPEPAQGQNP